MLMKVAEQFGFRVNTFTHILEGYKVADKMAAHGAGGSSFSDWWAYKYEVQEAIPYNGALMHEQGVTVAFNSDDAEMARRLNQEAAKAVLFGGVSEEDALKFVTLNPAKLLHLDEYVGSIKAGKHADVVLWSGHPLSMYSRAEKTFIDGTLFFDRAADLEARDFPALDELAAWLGADASRRLLLVGHTDNAGGLDGNIALSQRRAEAVARRLTERYGIAPDRIEARGIGYLAPRASNATAEGRQANRRVEAQPLPPAD